MSECMSVAMGVTPQLLGISDHVVMEFPRIDRQVVVFGWQPDRRDNECLFAEFILCINRKYFSLLSELAVLACK